MSKPTSELRDADAWQRFLTLLAPDPSRAAASYESLRRRLVDVFRWRGLAAAEDLADEALERAVRRVAAGDEIRSVVGYLTGIAHRLAMEAARREARVAPFDEVATPPPGSSDEELAGERLDSLERCLQRLPPQARALVLRYYGQGDDRINGRKRMAEDLGIGLNALRIRIHRLRNLLEGCLDESRSELAAPVPRAGRMRGGDS